ncbi:MAG: LytTR family transcriptional regulator DNA-binding domain-containing protein [Flavobacteriales bacterium]|nr:LytTR family transcriptional regulator DNA-binding domain-containing protein [Flavobacteriales bacterium]
MENKIITIQDAIVRTNDILSSVIQLQLSLEEQLQELIKRNNAPIITVKGAKKIDFIPVHEIIYCSANLSYTEIVAENHSNIVASKPINDFETCFSCYSFYRISKSILINVKQIHSYDRQNGQVIMKNKDVLDVARRRKSDFLSVVVPDY